MNPPNNLEIIVKYPGVQKIMYSIEQNVLVDSIVKKTVVVKFCDYQ